MTTAPTVPQPTTVKSQSLYQVAWIQFRKHSLARLGMLILVLLYLLAIFAGFISPYSSTSYESDVGRVSWAPPSQVHIRREDGRYTAPFIYGVKRTVNLETFRDDYVEDKSAIYPLRWFVVRPQAPYKLLGFIPMNVHLFGVRRSGAHFLVGHRQPGP